jgi:hypothetical protein
MVNAEMGESPRRLPLKPRVNRAPHRQEGLYLSDPERALPGGRGSQEYGGLDCIPYGTGHESTASDWHNPSDAICSCFGIPRLYKYMVCIYDTETQSYY